MKVSLNVWIDAETKEMIQHWVDRGQVKNSSEFAREAFKNQLYYLYMSDSKSQRVFHRNNQIRY